MIKNNRADRYGGGVYSGIKLYDCEISFNTAKKGGGIYGCGELRNCSVVKNNAEISSSGTSENGGGIYDMRATDGFGGTITNVYTNNIIWGNKTGAVVSNIRGRTPGAGSMTYCAVERDEVMPSGMGNIVIESANDGSDNALIYVRFSNPDDGDFTLMENSMCIDVGCNDYAAPGDYDLAGNDRIRGGYIDMGAYEQTPVNCKVPTNLDVPEELITYTTADVNWTPGGDETQWLVYYALSNGADVRTIEVDTNYVYLQNLHPNLEYFVKVRSVCGGDEMSSYCVPKYFRTQCDPDSIVWTNYLVEEGLVPMQNQTLESNSHIYFSWDYIDGAESYDLYLWRTDHGNGLPIPDFPVAYGLTRNYTTVDLDVSYYQGYGVYDHCPGWMCDPEPPVYLRQEDPYETAYYAWKVVAHKQCATIESDTMYFNTALPDLHVTSMDHSFAQTGQVMTVEWTVKNDGVGPTPVGAEWNDYIVLSYPVNWEHESFTNTPAESFLVASVPNLRALDPGDEYTNSVNITVPEDMYGSVFLFVLSNWTPYSGMSLNFTPYGGVFPNPYNPPYIPHDPGDPEGYMEGSCSPESFEEIHGCDNFFYQYIDVAIPPIPDMYAFDVNPPYEGIAGDSITVSWSLVNKGGAGFDSTYVTDVVYMSTKQEFDGSAIQLGTYADTISMMVGDTIVRSAKFATDERNIDTFFFFVRTDLNNKVYESLFEYNNLSDVSSHSTVLLPAPPPDLVIENLYLSKDTLSPNEEFRLGYEIRNIGYVSAKPNGGGETDTCGYLPPSHGKQWRDVVYISAFDTFDVRNATQLSSVVNDTILYTPTELQQIEEQILSYALCHYPDPLPLDTTATAQDTIAYEQELALQQQRRTQFIYDQQKKYKNGYMVRKKVKIPNELDEGKYYLYAFADRGDNIFEYLHEDNNMIKDSLYVVQPDLIVASLELNETRNVVNYVLTNIGRGAIIDQTISRKLYYNNANISSGSLTHINLQPNDSLHLEWPVSLNCNFYIDNTMRLQADLRYELDFTNNSKIVDLQLPNPDFEALDLECETILNSGQSVDVTYRIANEGHKDFDGVIDNGLYLGLSPELNFITAELLKTDAVEVTLDVNDTITVTQHFTLPIDAQGTYYFYVALNDGGEICEGDDVHSNYIVSDMLTISLSPYPDLVVNEASAPGQVTAGDHVSVNYQVGNYGIRDIRANEAWDDKVYISPYPQFDVNTATYVGMHTEYGPLAIGSTYDSQVSFTVPIDLAADNYYIYVVTDASDDFYEYVGEYNNVYQTTSFPLTAYQLDLAVTSFTGPEEVEWDEEVTYSFTVSNNGTQCSYGTWKDKLFFSTDEVWSDNDVEMKQTSGSMLCGGSSYTSTATFHIPYGYEGQYYLLAVADFEGVNPDLNPENNVMALPITISSIPVPNLEVSDVEILTEFPACGQPIYVAYRVTNVGDGPSYGSWTDQVRFSKNTFENGAVASSITRSDTLQPGDSYRDTVSYVVPVPQYGNYAVYVNSNTGESMFEMDYENNLVMVPAVVTLNAPGDLVVEEITAPTRVESGTPITITWNVKNLGPNELSGTGCSDVVYLSTDEVFDVNDKLLGTVTYDLVLPNYTSIQNRLTTNISGVQSGEYYIIVMADARNTFYETDEDNNRSCSALPFNLELPVLYFDTPVDFDLDKLTYADYKLEVGSNISETVLVYINTPDSLMGAVNNIYVLHNAVGDNMNFDFSTDGQMSGNSELYIPRTEAGYYGVSFFGHSPVRETQHVTVEARILPFEIRSIAPNVGANSGNVTVKLIGSKFRIDMPVWLSKYNPETGDSTLIYASSLRYVNFNQVYATFNLDGAPLGIYSMNAYNYCAGTYTLRDCFEVIEGEQGKLITNLIIPEGLRGNRYCCLTLEYGNLGNTDIVAPIIKLTSIDDSYIGLRRGELNIHRTELTIPLQVEGEPANILRPGVRGTVTIYCFTNGGLTFRIDNLTD